MNRYLIINPFGIGDVLFTTPVIRAIKKSVPDAYIGYWCNQRVKDLLKDDPDLDKIFSLSRGDIKKLLRDSRIEGLRRGLALFFGIKKEKFDVCIDFSLDHRYGLAAKLAGIKKRVGFDYKNRGLFLTDKIPITGYQGRHAVEFYLDLLRPLDIEPADGGLSLPVSEASVLKAKNILAGFGIAQGARLIAISPAGGLSWGKDARLKHWPAIKFSRFIEAVGRKVPANFIILADASEKPVTEVIAMSVKQKVIDLTGKLTLEELAGVIRLCDLLITNDGGTLHIAVACGTKTVSLFGPTDHRVYGPYPADPKAHIVIKSNVPCSPCYRHFRYPFCRNNVCLDDINVDEVAQAAFNLLGVKL